MWFVTELWYGDVVWCVAGVVVVVVGCGGGEGNVKVVWVERREMRGEVE